MFGSLAKKWGGAWALMALAGLAAAPARAKGYDNLPKERERWGRPIAIEQQVGSRSLFDCVRIIPDTFKFRDNFGAGSMSDVYDCQRKHFPVVSQADCKGTMAAFRRLSRTHPALAKVDEFREYLEDECGPAKVKTKPEFTPGVDPKVQRTKGFTGSGRSSRTPRTPLDRRVAARYSVCSRN